MILNKITQKNKILATKRTIKTIQVVTPEISIYICDRFRAITLTIRCVVRRRAYIQSWVRAGMREDMDAAQLSNIPSDIQS